LAHRVVRLFVGGNVDAQMIASTPLITDTSWVPVGTLFLYIVYRSDRP
jgi:hypothetical protein